MRQPLKNWNPPSTAHDGRDMSQCVYLRQRLTSPPICISVL